MQQFIGDNENEAAEKAGKNKIENGLVDMRDMKIMIEIKSEKDVVMRNRIRWLCHVLKMNVSD